jgi:hypothetical protein
MCTEMIVRIFQISKERRHHTTCLELNCGTYQLKHASFGHSWGDETFECQCGPLSGADLVCLEHATQTGMSVRLIFPEAKVLLSHIWLARIGDSGWVRIAGRVIQRDGDLPIK